MHLRTRFIIVISAVVLLPAGITFYGCSRDKGMIIPVCNTPATVSFSRDIIPLFEANCSKAGCHTGPAPAAYLNLDANVAYNKLMKRGSGYIDTVTPNFSLLYSQMISTSNPMPPAGRLDDCKTLLILKWISQKAKDN